MTLAELSTLSDEKYATLDYIACECEAEASNPNNPIEDRFELRDRAATYRGLQRDLEPFRNLTPKPTCWVADQE